MCQDTTYIWVKRKEGIRKFFSQVKLAKDSGTCRACIPNLIEIPSSSLVIMKCNEQYNVDLFW